MTSKMSLKLTAAMSLLAAVSAVGQANAIERVRSDLNTCAAVQKTLENRGELIIQYPSTRVKGLILYDRFVASCAFCKPGEDTVPATVPAKDNPECGVLRCAPISSGNDECAPPSRPQQSPNDQNPR